MKKLKTIFILILVMLFSCGPERQVYNTSDHGYRHGRKTRYYSEYRGYAHRGDFNKGYDGSGWERR